MKLVAIISLYLVLVNVFTESGNSTNSVVYICTGPKAAVYHRTKHCSGLNRCSGDIVSVSLSKAKGMGRRRARSVIRL